MKCSQYRGARVFDGPLQFIGGERILARSCFSCAVVSEGAGFGGLERGASRGAGTLRAGTKQQGLERGGGPAFWRDYSAARRVNEVAHLGFLCARCALFLMFGQRGSGWWTACRRVGIVRTFRGYCRRSWERVRRPAQFAELERKAKREDESLNRAIPDTILETDVRAGR